MFVSHMSVVIVFSFDSVNSRFAPLIWAEQLRCIWRVLCDFMAFKILRIKEPVVTLRFLAGIIALIVQSVGAAAMVSITLVSTCSPFVLFLAIPKI